VRLYQKAQLVKKVKDASGSDLPMGWLKPCMTNAGPESAIRLLSAPPDDTTAVARVGRLEQARSQRGSMIQSFG